MRKLTILLLAVFVLAICPYIAQAQYTFFNPKDAFAIEVSLPNTAQHKLPMYRNAILSLAVVGDFIVGGTAADAGLAPFVFVASIKEKKLIKVQDIEEVLRGQRSIQSGFVKGKNNVLYAGTMANSLSNGSAGDGHLIEIKIASDGSIQVKDLVVPVKGEGVFSLTGNPKGNLLFGVSHPSGTFFKYDIQSGKVQTYDKLVPTEKDIRRLGEYSLEPEDYLSRALIADDQGLIYGSAPVNELFVFNPKDDSFTTLSDVPEVWGRRTLGQVESWVKAKDGTLYGGNAGDGQLFSVNPKTKQVKNLGKPIMMPRLRGLAFGNDGKLYGIAGALPGYAHLFSYDAKNEGFRDLGNPEFKMVEPGIEQGILWRGFQLGSIAASEDGKYIVMGEDEALSQLLIFAVGGEQQGRIGY